MSVHRMKVMNEKHHGNITNRGNVPKSLKNPEDSPNVNAWILGLIVFIVCGSALFEIIQHIRF